MRVEAIKTTMYASRVSVMGLSSKLRWALSHRSVKPEANTIMYEMSSEAAMMIISQRGGRSAAISETSSVGAMLKAMTIAPIRVASISTRVSPKVLLMLLLRVTAADGSAETLIAPPVSSVRRSWVRRRHPMKVLVGS